MIEASGLRKSYYKGRQNEVKVMQDISLSLPERGMVAIFGRSGCGKTTLLNVLGGLDKADSGRVLIEGEDLSRNTDALRNRAIGYIFQNYNLNRLENCFENVADALRLVGMRDSREIEERTVAALKNVGMERYLRRMPDALSGGQQQRIAIARAIVKNPRIILADEPTGNLDEANTIMVMELLREISRDHLVVLVTHEAKLVDWYCDLVIELSDGKIVNMRENTPAEAYQTRNRNDIFLADLPHFTEEGPFVSLDFYGEKPDQPLRLTLVQHEGKLYLKTEDSGVQLLTGDSEVRLRQEHYVPEAHAREQRARIDMSRLSPVNGSHYGSLFSFRSSVKSGFRANFPKQFGGKDKKSSKLMRMTLFLFAGLMVLLAGFIGKAVKSFLDIRESYDHYIFGIFTPDAEVSGFLREALTVPEAAVDASYMGRCYSTSGTDLKFNLGCFETFSVLPWNNDFSASANLLPISLAADLPLASGQKEDLNSNDIVISTAVADQLLKVAGVGFMKEYRDLLNVFCTSLSIDGRSCRIAGIVECDEPAVYLPEMSLAVYLMDITLGLPVYRGSSFGIDVKPGEVILVMEDSFGQEIPQQGSSVTIHGLPLSVGEILKVSPENPAHDCFYEMEWWGTESYKYFKLSYYINYFVSDETYLAITKQFGETMQGAGFYYGDGQQEIDGNRIASWSSAYTVLHSSDPDKTAAYLQSMPERFRLADGESKVLITPQGRGEELLAEAKENLVSQCITFGVLALIMALCMYFMMRSALMNRVKELGIYRAIGVSKKNLLFRFSIESLTLMSLTSLPGFLLGSGVMFYWTYHSRLMAKLLHYPVSYAFVLLAVLLLLTLLCGTLPLRLLLRRTPSEILAKYDI